MLDNLASFETKDVDPGPVVVSGPFLAGVKNNEVVFSQRSNEMDAFAGAETRLLSFRTRRVKSDILTLGEARRA